MSANRSQPPNSLEHSHDRELRLLEEVESAPQVSQRQLAQQLGIAIGVANLLVRSLAKRGYIRVTRVGWKRWVYVVTPAGIARKLHLTLDYVDRFMGHYRKVRTLLREDMRGLPITPDSRVAICGVTELAELMYLALRDMGVTNIDFLDPDGPGRSFLGMPAKGLDAIVPGEYTKVIVAYSGDVSSTRFQLHSFGVSENQIVTLFDGNSNDATVANEIEVSS